MSSPKTKPNSKNNTSLSALLYCCMLALLLPGQAQSQSQSQSQSQNKTSEYRLNKAVIIAKHAPRYPYQELQRGQEGWVTMSVVVDPQGQVRDPIVVNSSGGRGFETAALAAVKKFKYQPATLNGEAIESADNRVKISFAIERHRPTATRKFHKLYRSARSSLKAGKLEKAAKTLAKMRDEYANNQYELAHLAVLESNYYHQTKAHGKRLQSLKRVVTYYKNQLSKEAYIGALTELYKAQAALNRIRGLLATATLIESYTAEQPDLQSLLKHRDQVLEVLAQHPYIDTPAEINSDRPWQHGLYYKTFGFTVSSGKLHKIELRCDKKIRRFAITKDQQSWQIPASWGDCDLFTWGTQGTKFNLVEKRQDEPKD